MVQPVAMVTGASNGIGYATAQLLAERGHKVYATCRNPSEALELQALARRNSNLSILALDVDLDESVTQAVKDIFERSKRIDVVVNNAGFGIYGTPEMHTIREAQAIFNTNLFGVMRVNQAVIPIMRTQLAGRIINIGSVAGAIPSKNLSIYSAAKAALEIMSATDAHRLAPINVSVSVVIPGPVVTKFKSRTAFATRFPQGESPYEAFLADDRGGWEKFMDGGQSPVEVARVVLRAIEDREPDFWYITSQTVKESIGRHFKDLTGNRRIPQSHHRPLAKL